MRIHIIIVINLVFLLISTSAFSQKQRILLDGDFNDWTNRDFDFEDAVNDGKFGYDFTRLTIENDENYLYFSFDVSLDINLQDNNDIVLMIDCDNDIETGYLTDNIGADLIYYFGNRSGYYINENGQKEIRHDDIGLITLPTVSSYRFEIGLNRLAKINGQNIFNGSKIRTILLHDVDDGDKLPDASGGVLFTISEENQEALPSYKIAKAADIDLRILSYNVLFDQLFYNPNPFKRQIAALYPDIIAFQEIYDHSAGQTLDFISSLLDDNWYAAKQGSDIILISKYPIKESHYVKGNGAFLVEHQLGEILIINAHLPCCDNDSGRQDEVDGIMAFIRDAQLGESSLDLKENTPIIILGDMNFVGKSRQVKTFLEGDIQNNFKYGEDFKADWDGSNFKDALSFATHTPMAFTWYDLGSSFNPGRLDYIIYSDAVLNLKNTFNLFSGALPQDSLNKYALLKSDTESASDHIPVIADFKWKDNSSTINNAEQSVIIQPNPFGDYIEINIDDKNIVKSNISVYNINGECVFTRKYQMNKNIKINSQNWSSGIYFIKIKRNDQLITRKIIKI